MYNVSLNHKPLLVSIDLIFLVNALYWFLIICIDFVSVLYFCIFLECM